MSLLRNKVAVVTGGSSGLGKGIAKRFATEGASVVITDVDEDLGSAVAREIGATFVLHDVTNEGQWREAIERVETQCGCLDILVNCAGIVAPIEFTSPEDTRLDDWRRIFATNVEGVFLGCKTAIGAMRQTGDGSIINVSSIAGLLATPFATAYGASMAAVRQLTKTVAQYCAQEKLSVRCNSIHPGLVISPDWDKIAVEHAQTRGIKHPEVLSEMLLAIPWGELSLPADIAAAATFLASEDGRFITGEDLVVDGGVVNCDSYNLMKHSELAVQLVKR